MAGNNISTVDLGDLSRIAQEQEAAVQAGKQQLQQVVSQSEALTSSWQGDAANAYRTALQDFDDKGNAVIAALQRMADMMKSTQAVFSNTHNTTTQQARSAVQAADPSLHGLKGI